jgi:TusA-related sulfurtransferase
VFIAFAYEKWLDKEKEIRVITGHGAIQKEFPSWCEACNHVRKWETEPYNRGSWKVRLR